MLAIPTREGAAGAPGPTPAASELARAIAALGEDRLVAFRTETVWGLAACARSEAAMEALRRFKGRDAGQPVSVLISASSVLPELGVELSARAQGLVDAFWPGPLTLVVPCRGRFARGVQRADGAIGLRCSPHPEARTLVEAAEREGLGPLTATSLNLSGDPPARTEAAARALCSGAGAPHVFAPSPDEAQPAAPGLPSTVLDLTTEPPRALRMGGVDADALARHTPFVDASTGADPSPAQAANGREEPTR